MPRGRHASALSSRPASALSCYGPAHTKDTSNKGSKTFTKDVFADRDIPMVQNFTPLPHTISRAAAKRLGIQLDELNLSTMPSARRRQSISLMSDFDTDEAISQKKPEYDSSNNPRLDYAEPLVTHILRDSWPLTNNIANTLQKEESLGEDGYPHTSIVSHRSSRTIYDADLPINMRDCPQEKTPTASTSSQAESRVRKLEWLTGSPMSEAQMFDYQTETRPTTPRQPLSDNAQVHPAFRVHDQVPPAMPKRYDFEAHMQEIISPDAAEKVIQCILERIDSFDDIFAAARINRGFYSVFKRHELDLMKRVLYNASPAEWEYRETCAKEIMPGRRNNEHDYTPTTYVQFHKRDSYILQSLRVLMFSRCRLLLRQETINALHTQTSARAKRVDDAFWRIWTFCDMFGGGKGAGNDFDAQRLWLNGGTAAAKHSSGRRSRRARHVSASSFGKGNEGGLGIQELEDLLEVWKCMRYLLNGMLGPGRAAQARRCGLFNGIALEYSSEAADEAMLQEWIHYVLTLGPSTVVDLAGLAHSKSSNVFKTARDMGWTTWTPCPKDWCRSKFLIDVVTALIAERRLVPFSKNVRSHAVVLGPRHGHGQPVNRSRKLGHRHIIAPSLIELENSVGIWVSWASKHEEPVSAQPARPLPQVPVVAKHHQRHRPVVPAHDSKGAGYFVPPPSVPSIACQDARSTTQSFTPR